LVDAVPRQSTPESTATKETTVVTAPNRGRLSKHAVVERREDGALSTLKFSAITDPDLHISEPTEDVSSTALGIALVGSALRKKVPWVSPALTVAGMAECYMELTSTRKKSNAPVSVAPPNFIESDDAERGDTGSEVRLSQSDVHIRFPADVGGTATSTGDVNQNTEAAATNIPPSLRTRAETAIADPGNGAEARFVAPITESDGVAVCGNAMSGVAAHEDECDAPIAPGEVATPVSESADAAGKISVVPKSHRTPTTTAFIPGSAEEKAARKVKYDSKQRMLREIAANQLLQEELAKSDLNLVSVASFMNRVCDTDRGAQLLKEAADLLIQKGITEKLTAETIYQKVTTFEETVVPTTLSAKHVELTGKAAVFATPCEPSEVNIQTVSVARKTCETEARVTATVADMRDATLDANDASVRVEDTVTQGPDESDAISLADTVMSIGGSLRDGSPAHSTCGLSVSGSESRKRAADEFPNREREGSSRRDFPGRVTRSAAG